MRCPNVSPLHVAIHDVDVPVTKGIVISIDLSPGPMTGGNVELQRQGVTMLDTGGGGQWSWLGVRSVKGAVTIWQQ